MSRLLPMLGGDPSGLMQSVRPGDPAAAVPAVAGALQGADPQAGMSSGSTAGGPQGAASSIFQQLYGSPEFKQAMLSNGLMSLGTGILKASGPSTMKTSIGGAFGQGLQNAQQGIEGTRDRFAKDMMLGAQFDSNRQAMAIQRQWMDYMQRQAGVGGGAAGAGAATPAGSPQSAAGGGAGGPPNPNNPGNIITGRNPDGTLGFRAYDTPEAGVAALIRNVQAYPAAFNGGQPMTIAQIGQRWAPKDNRGTDPVKWAQAVAQISGLPIDKPIDVNDPQVALALARGVHGIEHGPQAAYAPEVYQRGVQMAFGGRPTQMAAAGPSAPTGTGLTVPRVTSPEQIQALQPGQQFIAPDGSVRVR